MSVAHHVSQGIYHSFKYSKGVVQKCLAVSIFHKNPSLGMYVTENKNFFEEKTLQMCLRYITCQRFLSTNKYITCSNEYFKGKTRCNNDIPYFARKSIHLLKCNFLFFIVYRPRPTFFWPYDFAMQAFSKQLFSFPEVAVKLDPTFSPTIRSHPCQHQHRLCFFITSCVVWTLGRPLQGATPGVG